MNTICLVLALAFGLAATFNFRARISLLAAAVTFLILSFLLAGVTLDSLHLHHVFH